METGRWIRVGRYFLASFSLFMLVVVPGYIAAGQWTPVVVFTALAAIWLLYWLRLIGDRSGSVVGFVGMWIALGLVALVAPGLQSGVLVFPAIVAGASFGLRTGILLIALCGATELAADLLRLLPPQTVLSSSLNVLLVGAAGAGGRMLVTANAELREAREEIARLAVTEERLRFARDVHDLLGQSLSTIVLKSELAARRLPASADDDLRAELHDIATVARRALDDVRETVSGYRRPGLRSELAAARSALRSAGISLRVEQDLAAALSASREAVLAWGVREAVTNVLRHSGARHCRLRLTEADGMVVLEVSDDGRGAQGVTGGSGVVGLRERAAAIGGTVEVATAAAAGFTLTMRVPAEGKPAEAVSVG